MHLCVLGYSSPKYIVYDEKLKEVRARAKITKESKLSQEALQPYFTQLGTYSTDALKQRVDIVFSAKVVDFPVKDGVNLNVTLKNVGRLTVKLYEINASSYYRSKNKEVDATIELDGLSAHHEEVHDYTTASPFHCLKRTLAFPQLANRRGLFVIELLGNGQRARALIRKGRIFHLEHPTPIGHVFRLFDEAG